MSTRHSRPNINLPASQLNAHLQQGKYLAVDVDSEAWNEGRLECIDP